MITIIIDINVLYVIIIFYTITNYLRNAIIFAQKTCSRILNKQCHRFDQFDYFDLLMGNLIRYFSQILIHR